LARPDGTTLTGATRQAWRVVGSSGVYFARTTTGPPIRGVGVVVKARRSDMKRPSYAARARATTSVPETEGQRDVQVAARPVDRGGDGQAALGAPEVEADDAQLEPPGDVRAPGGLGEARRLPVTAGAQAQPSG